MAGSKQVAASTAVVRFHGKDEDKVGFVCTREARHEDGTISLKVVGTDAEGEELFAWESDRVDFTPDEEWISDAISEAYWDSCGHDGSWIEWWPDDVPDVLGEPDEEEEGEPPLDIRAVRPGDVISRGGKTAEYVFIGDDGEMGISAVNQSWIRRGRMDYGDELCHLDTVALEGYRVVGHFGNGSQDDGIKWLCSHEDVAEAWLG